MLRLRWNIVAEPARERATGRTQVAGFTSMPASRRRAGRAAVKRSSTAVVFVKVQGKGSQLHHRRSAG